MPTARKHENLQAELENTLNGFCSRLRSLFGERLVSVVLYGSAIFDDLAPGYGDLDFLAVVEGDLSEQDCRSLVELRRPLRSENAGIYDHMLEGAFLPRHMLDPMVAGRAFWWGTSGERPWDRNRLGPLVLHVIRERGRVLCGQNIRPEIPAVSRHDMLQDVREFCRSASRHGRGGTLHSVDWLLSAARMLLLVRQGRLSSKSEAADWGHQHAAGDWRMKLPDARRLRLNFEKATEPQWQNWLASLDEPIRQAVAELEDVLKAG